MRTEGWGGADYDEVAPFSTQFLSLWSSALFSQFSLPL